MSQTNGMIFDIRKFSVNDGPGIRTTIFFKGCPLDCWWCHNPESQSPSPEMMLWEKRCTRCGECVTVCPIDAIQPVPPVGANGADDAPATHAAQFAGDRAGTLVQRNAYERTLMTLPEAGPANTDRSICTVCGACVDACTAEARQVVGRRATVDEVMDEIMRDRAFYEHSQGGVTFSGGEPLMQRGFLLALLRACKDMALHTSLDTSGFAPWEALDETRPWTDLYLYDLKLADEARHREATGVSNRIIIENLQKLAQCGSRIVLRVPLIPGVNDDAQNLNGIAEIVKGLPLERVDLLPYHAAAEGKYERLGRAYRLPQTPSPADEQVDAAAQIFQSRGFAVQVGG